MLKRFKILFLLPLCCAFTVPQQGDIFCGIKNNAFKAGETVTMKIFYNAAGVYIGAGEAVFTTTLERFNGRQTYHCVAEGKSYTFFDKFFKVRDRYESYIDTATMLPVKFIRNVDEGGYKIYNNVTFNHSVGTAVSTNGVYKTTNCIQDAISSVYYARNIDFSRYKVNDKIPFDLFLDDEVHHLYLRYLGKEVIKTRYGKFRAIKFKPLLVKGATFAEGGEKMTAWVSDDPNRLLLRVESPIAVGTIKVDMYGYSNLRYPLTSLISVR
ncbi:MAG TPA: DUF3108 domain-containing protein [Ferruginibacter sp.]|nr:DUF3108 domain-containing protein [Ferruginibacter sp.]HMP20866.1 DUF3108 domain-containing protein [Ferruginibacter sp.]